MYKKETDNEVKKANILLVDDKVENLFALEKLLVGEDRNFMKASSGKAALKFAYSNEIALVLLDVQMPEMNGFEVATMLKSNPKTSNIPIIFVTAISKEQKYVLKGFESGAIDYLFKPLDVEVTRAKVATYIKMHFQQKELEEKNVALENLASLVDNSLDITCIFDFEKFEIEEVNQTFKSILGYEPNETIGKSIIDFFYTEDPEETKTIIQDELNKNKDIFVFENRVKDSNNEEKWMRWKIIVKEDKCFASGADITVRKQTERKLSENLAYLVKINKELAEAKRTAEESVKIKQDFMANMSHEIRTPMNAIIGFTNLVLKTELTEEQRKNLDSVKISGENLIVIINDILDFSKIEAGKMSIEKAEFDIHSVLNELIKMQKISAKEKGIELELNLDEKLPQVLVGDSVRLNQILLNLVSNAIKFTIEGKVKLDIHCDKIENGVAYTRFECVDSGVGIPTEKLESIFESFTQAKGDTTRKFGGTGLGLTIVKKLVDLMKGSIKVESEVDNGSKFIVKLEFPVGTEDGKVKEEEETDAPTAELGSLNILLAEDNELNQILAKRVLNNYGFNVEIAENGQIAVNRLKENDYDIILMDIMMPEMDGLEATKIIREEFDSPKKNIPILAMTAFIFTDTDDNKYLSSGMDDFILKPFNPEKLKQKIAKLVLK